MVGPVRAGAGTRAPGGESAGPAGGGGRPSGCWGAGASPGPGGDWRGSQRRGLLRGGGGEGWKGLGCVSGVPSGLPRSGPRGAAVAPPPPGTEGAVARGDRALRGRGSAVLVSGAGQPGRGVSWPELEALGKAGESWPVTAPWKMGISGTDQSSGRKLIFTLQLLGGRDAIT